jgi:hypothetical protein
MYPKLVLNTHIFIYTHLAPSLKKFHYEKLCLFEPHYLSIKTLKTTHVQPFCNYPLNVTISVQLSPRYMVY